MVHQLGDQMETTPQVNMAHHLRVPTALVALCPPSMELHQVQVDLVELLLPNTVLLQLEGDLVVVVVVHLLPDMVLLLQAGLMVVVVLLLHDMVFPLPLAETVADSPAEMVVRHSDATVDIVMVLPLTRMVLLQLSDAMVVLHLLNMVLLGVLHDSVPHPTLMVHHLSDATAAVTEVSVVLHLLNMVLLVSDATEDLLLLNMVLLQPTADLAVFPLLAMELLQLMDLVETEGRLRPVTVYHLPTHSEETAELLLHVMVLLRPPVLAGLVVVTVALVVTLQTVDTLQTADTLKMEDITTMAGDSEDKMTISLLV